jgi:hypothetical protein
MTFTEEREPSFEFRSVTSFLSAFAWRSSRFQFAFETTLPTIDEKACHRPRSGRDQDRAHWLVSFIRIRTVPMRICLSSFVRVYMLS